uniref:Uncharacterized protein n=1 Tax=Arion vulgaris TaxID=1028688 RepID=A0A0B6ZYN7_9EUPU
MPLEITSVYIEKPDRPQADCPVSSSHWINRMTRDCRRRRRRRRMTTKNINSNRHVI